MACATTAASGCHRRCRPWPPGCGAPAMPPAPSSAPSRWTPASASPAASIVTTTPSRTARIPTSTASPSAAATRWCGLPSPGGGPSAPAGASSGGISMTRTRRTSRPNRSPPASATTPTWGRSRRGAPPDYFLPPLLPPFLDGKEKPALIVFTADHGEALGEHGELTHGLFAYEATLKVPLVVWGPGVSPGRDLRPARHVDIVPTVLQALRLPVPPGLPGRSLLAPAPPAGAVSSYFEALSASLTRGWAPLRGTLRDRQKMIDLPLPELYDLRDDPGEQRNRYDRDRPTARALAAQLPAESAWPPAKGKVSSEEAARLGSLGYLTATASHAGAYTVADDPKRLVGGDGETQRALALYAARRF